MLLLIVGAENSSIEMEHFEEKAKSKDLHLSVLVYTQSDKIKVIIIVN